MYQYQTKQNLYLSVNNIREKIKEIESKTTNQAQAQANEPNEIEYLEELEALRQTIPQPVPISSIVINIKFSTRSDITHPTAQSI